MTEATKVVDPSMDERVCALEGCGRTFIPAPNQPHRRWCSTRCQQKGRPARDWAEINRRRNNGEGDTRTYADRREDAGKWRAANREKLSAWHRDYWRRSKARRESKRISGAAWAKKNPERVRAYMNKAQRQRRGRMLAGGGFVDDRDWQRLVNRYRGLCAYCGIEPYAHQDHVVPLSRGGRHSIGNVLPACARCNFSKSAKLLVEWRYSPGNVTRAIPLTSLG